MKTGTSTIIAVFRVLTFSRIRRITFVVSIPSSVTSLLINAEYCNINRFIVLRRISESIFSKS